MSRLTTLLAGAFLAVAALLWLDGRAPALPPVPAVPALTGGEAVDLAAAARGVVAGVNRQEFATQQVVVTFAAAQFPVGLASRWLRAEYTVVVTGTVTARVDAARADDLAVIGTTARLRLPPVELAPSFDIADIAITDGRDTCWALCDGERLALVQRHAATIAAALQARADADGLRARAEREARAHYGRLFAAVGLESEVTFGARWP